MGIPGLLSEVSRNHLRFRPAKSFEDGVFHVDGLNLMSNVVHDVNTKRKDGILDDYERKLERITGKLLQYKPKSITVYFDAFFPPSKVAERASRRHRKLKELHSYRQVLLPADLMARWLFAHHPDIKIVYTGLEAEEEILQGIYEQRSMDRHFIFSSDSDLFTFQMPSAHAIDIVPLAGHTLGRRGAHTINLGRVQRSSIVPKKFQKQMPLKRIGTTVVADRPMRYIVELVNIAKSTGKFIANTSLLYNPGNISPFDIGLEIRRCGYGATIERFFPGDHPVVYEEGQDGLQLVTRKLDPILGQDLALASRVICETPLSGLLELDLLQLQQKYCITDVEIVALMRYVEDLSHGLGITTSQTLHPRIPVLYPLLVAFLVSMELFCMANGGQPVSLGLLWKITPFDLSSYLW